MPSVNWVDLVEGLQRTRGNFGDNSRQQALLNRLSAVKNDYSNLHNTLLAAQGQRTASMGTGAPVAGTTFEATGGQGGLDTNFQSALNRLMQESGGRISIGSGYRSVAEQQRLYDLWKAGKHKVPRVAPPGRSNHNRGLAADLKFANAAARQWAHQNAARFGLYFPMGDEPWHVEPLSLRRR